jgi:nucleolar protein 56
LSTVTLEETIIGVYAINQKNQIIAQKNYPNDPHLISEKLKMQKQGIITSHIKKVMDTLIEKKIKKITSSNKELLEKISTSYDVETEYRENTLTSKFIRLNIENLAIKSGIIINVSDFGRLSHSVLNQITKDDIKEKMSKREALLIPSIQLLSDLDKTLNGFSNRMREWYGIHFPEMSDKVSKHNEYAKIVLNIGEKASITTEKLQKINLNKNEAKKIKKAAKESIGADLVEIDLISIQNYAKIILDLYKYRLELSEYIASLSLDIAPNLHKIAGPILSAKLIEKAGGLQKMARLPASTIQILGAEKAMFRSLKTRAKQPKHGLIYQHPYVHSASRKERGSRSRSLAAKIAIAARADFFTGKYIADDLISRLSGDQSFFEK